MQCSALFFPGPSPPAAPEMLTTPTDTLFHNSALVQWQVPHLTYGPERYQVLYGTSENALSFRSGTVDSPSDITCTDLQFSVELTDLNVTTTYYFLVEATNILNNTNRSEVSTFSTTDLRRELWCDLHAVL